MRIAAALSKDPDSARATEDVVERVLISLEGEKPDLAFVFVSAGHLPHSETLLGILREQLGARVLLGCGAGGLIGEGQEVEFESAISLWAAALPDVGIQPFHVLPRMVMNQLDFAGWPHPEPAASEVRAMLLFADPFTTPIDQLFDFVEGRFSGLPIIGGLASAGMSQGENRLFCGDRISNRGAVGVILSGPIDVRTVVSQGCRPFGRQFIVTKSERNVIQELGGKPALARLQEVLQEAEASERSRAKRGLQIGKLMNEYSSSTGQGDFLIRSVVQVDTRTQSLAINDLVRRGQTVKFQIRDAEAAHEDLVEALACENEAMGEGGACGALLFSCNGRGSHLFSEDHHDVSAVHSELGDIPVTGFFAAGEIGPVGKKNYLHGFTASLALLRPGIA